MYTYAYTGEYTAPTILPQHAPYTFSENYFNPFDVYQLRPTKILYAHTRIS